MNRIPANGPTPAYAPLDIVRTIVELALQYVTSADIGKKSTVSGSENSSFPESFAPAAFDIVPLLIVICESNGDNEALADPIF
jgi:hypothetical protein